MRALAMLAVLVALAAVVSCSAPERGTVVSKRYEPAHEWTSTYCAAYTPKGMCSMWLPQTHHEPERWVLVLRSGDDEGDRVVYREAYERCVRGADYPVCAEVAR